MPRRFVATVMTTSRSFGMTMGRRASVEGQIGVITKASRVGWTIGPPAEREWAVEPVGVATIMPSALKETILRPSISILSSINRADIPWFITASLRARNVSSLFLSR